MGENKYLKIMLIDQFILFLKEAGRFPMNIWAHNYFMARRSFLADLSSIQSRLKQNTPSVKKLSLVVELLAQTDPQELQLAESFVSLGEVLHDSGLSDSKIKEFQRLAELFLKRVKNQRNFSNLRARVAKNLSLSERKEYDRRLFQNEGLSYCLLYYLTFYKTMRELATAKERNDFVLQAEINLGFGALPGIKIDFEKDECREKFIELILNDELRSGLIREYYWCKQVIVKTKNFQEVECVLHDFLNALLIAFDREGVTSVANAFFAPYGKDATIKKIAPFFYKEYAPNA